MKLKLLSPELQILIGDVTTSTGDITSVKIRKKNNFIILETFGVYLETDLIVSGLTASRGEYTDKITLEWNSFDGVDGYKVIKSPNQLLSIQSGTTFEDFGEPQGKLTKYIVKTYVEKDGLTYDSKSVYADGWKKLSSPTLRAVGDTDTPRVILDWDFISGATAYKIFKTQSSDPNLLSIIGITTDNFFVDKKIQFGKVYTYAVKSSNPLNDSDFSNTQNVLLVGQVPAAPAQVFASTGTFDDKIRVTWTPVNNTFFYNVYRDVDSNRIATGILGTEFEDTFIDPDEAHIYGVAAENDKGQGPVTFSSSGWIGLTAPNSFIAANGGSTNSILLSWSPVSGANSYIIYKGSPLQEYQLGMPGVSFNDTSGVEYGTIYNYGIKAIGDLSQSIIVEDTGFVDQWIPESAPTGVSASDGAFTDRIQIEWNPVTTIQGVSGYQVFKGSDLFTTTTSTSTIDTSVTPGVTAEYTVNAFNLAGAGPLSFGNTGWIRLSPPQTLTATSNLPDRIDLNWVISQGATAYKVFTGKAFNPDVDVSLLGVTTNTQFTDFTPTFGNGYTYAVKSSCLLGDSEYSSIVLGRVIQSPPEFAPIGVSASDGAFTDRVEIQWDPVTTIQGVSGYQVFKGSDPLTTTSSTSTTDTSITPGVTAEYFVRAFNEAGNGPLSSGNTGWIKLSPPSNLIASKSTSFTEIFLNWSGVNGAQQYKIFRGTPSSLSLLDNTTNTFYTNSGLSNGDTFAYAVKASVGLGDSDFSNIDIGETGTPVPLPDPPTGVSASDGTFTDKIQIQWNPVAGISGYVVFRGTQQIDLTTNETYDDTTSLRGVTFNYSVASRNLSGIGTPSSTDEGWKKLIPPTILTATTTLQDRINLNWSAAQGATAYKVFTGKAFNPDVDVTLLGVTTNTQFIDFTPTFGNGYTYAVKSSCVLGDSEYSSLVLGRVTQSPPESAPTGVSASDGAFTDRVFIEWNPVTTIQGVSGYQVFKGSDPLTIVTNTSTTDTSITPGVTAEYFVRAFNEAGNGPLSSGNTGWIKLSPPQQLQATTTFPDRINLSWLVASGATAYKVFTGKAFNPDVDVTLLGVTTNTQFIDFTPTFGNGYTYAVKSSSTLGDSEYSSTALGRVTQSPPEFAPTGVSASDGAFTDRVFIQWNPVTTIQGVSGYIVNKFNSSGVLVRNPFTAATSLTDTLGTPGITFTYRIQAVNLAGNGPLSSDDLGWKGLSAPTQFSATDGTFNDRVQLTWNSIHGSEISYRVYKGNPLSPLTTTTTTSFTDTSAVASPGVTLQYAVTAFSALPIESTFSNLDTGFLGLDAPTNIAATNGSLTDRVEITWNPVAGAQQYKIYKDEIVLPIGITFSNSFGDTLATPGITHQYFVSTFLPGFPYESTKSSGITGWKKLSAPSGLTASKGDFSDRVRISWNSVAGATAYKIFKADSFTPEINVNSLGITTNTIFFDTTTTGISGATYAVKASCSLGDSDYSNIDTGYVNSIYSDILQFTNDIQARYLERVNGVYTSMPPRLTPYQGEIFYNPMTGKPAIEGLTGLPTAHTGFSGITKGKNIYDNAAQILYTFGLNGGPQGGTLLNGNTFNLGITAYFPTDKRINKYQHLGWFTDLNLQRGITSRGGTASWFIKPHSFNDLLTRPYPGYSIPTDVWGNPRNKLLYHLATIDTLIGTVYSDLEDLAAAWKFGLQCSSNMTGLRTFSRTDLFARINNQDNLDLIKNILTEIKRSYPLVKPENSLNESATTRNQTQTWMNNSQYGGLSGGFRKPVPPIGATLDNVPGMGITNTFSPGGITGDQGEYLFEGWSRRDLVNAMHLLTGVTVGRMPEGISGGQLLTTLPGWDEIITGIKDLLVKEIRDHLAMWRERRSWYQKVNNNLGRDTEYQNDIDNLGWLTNQWIEPICGTLQAIMYVYPFATTNTEKTAIRAAYNTVSEALAGILERMLFSVNSGDEAGAWIESWGYASQSMDSIIYTLMSMKNMGDRRLWDGKIKRGTGVTYSEWVNNAWKWDLTRIMPNGLVMNVGSTDADAYTDPSNSYNITGRPLTIASILASENPAPGTPNSALAQTYKMFRKIWGWSGLGIFNRYMYEQKLYSESVNDANPVRIFKTGYYYPTDQTFSWRSQFIIPIEQFAEFDKAYDFEKNRGTTLTSKPFVFGIWGKGAGKFDGKAHRDEGHVSAYMGDAIILLETGEIRADTSTSRALFEKYASGHNRMQLGEFISPMFPRSADISAINFGETGGSIFIDYTNSCNIRSVTAAPPSDFTGKGGAKDFPIGVPWGYLHNWTGRAYQYQIQKVTRGISWSYEPYNKVSSYIKITDFVGLSGICGGASGPTDRVYYRFHVGYTGATSGTDPGFNISEVFGTSKKVWNIGWTQSTPLNIISGGYTCDFVGITMTVQADQPIEISKILASNRAMKWSGNTSFFASQTKHYAIDVRLGLSGAQVHDQNRLNLTTEINSMVFRSNAPIIIPTETPQIRHYSPYTLNSTTSIGKNTGCSLQFAAPTNVFPSWDSEISQYSGISFGKLLIRDFTVLAARAGFTLPNSTWTCS